jgi:hypothetical protein
MPLLRFMTVALVAVSAAVPLGLAARAEPLDKESCRQLESDRKRLLTREMQVALERGPDWVKDHLNTGEIEKVREFLSVEEMIEFRCRGGGVDKNALSPNVDSSTPPLPDRKPTPPPSAIAADDPDHPSPPDRKPISPPAATADANASQTVADSDKTAPSKAKATR